MALVLRLRIGEAAYVGDTPLRLDEIYSSQHVLVKNMKTGESHDVSMAQAFEVLPDIFVALGDKTTTVAASLAFDAPRNIKILHGTRYQELHHSREAVRPPPASTPDLRDFRVPADIIELARELGIGNPGIAVRQMVRLSTPITMPGYNRRFQQYVLFVENGTVLAMDVLSAEDRAYFDSRHYEDRVAGDDHTAGEAEVEYTKTSRVAKANRF
jgi:hypothetical protein